MKQILFALFLLIPCIVLGEVIVPMERQENGLYLIPCKVNGVPMKFIFDTGASNVNISMAEAVFLLKNGYIQESDIKGNSHAQIANGEIVENTRILLNKIEIGGVVINNVDATVSHNLNAPLLLGQSAISKLGTIQLEDTNLIIKEPKGVERQNDSIFDLFKLGLIVLLIAAICYLVHIVKFKKHNCTHKTEALGKTSQKNNNHSRIESILSWLKCRKYVLYIAYCFMLLLSTLVIELHIKNKCEKLYSELRDSLQNTFGDINQSIDALDFNRIDEIEYEEVSIPKLFKDDNNAKRDKRKKKQWNKMFSGIKHVYKITDEGWQMAGMQYSLIPNKDRYVKEGIQDYFFFPYMICVPDGLEFNNEIAKTIIEKSLDKVYCEPDQYNTASGIKSTQNEYYHFVGNTFLQDSLPELCMRFYNESTGTDPIYDNNKFTGYYWFGMHKIGQYRVIYAYQNGIAWRIEEKDGFKASIKDRVIYHGITFIILTIILFLILYRVRKTKMAGMLM